MCQHGASLTLGVLLKVLMEGGLRRLCPLEPSCASASPPLAVPSSVCSLCAGCVDWAARVWPAHLSESSERWLSSEWYWGSGAALSSVVVDEILAIWIQFINLNKFVTAGCFYPPEIHYSQSWYWCWILSFDLWLFTARILNLLQKLLVFVKVIDSTERKNVDVKCCPRCWWDCWMRRFF